MIVDAVSWHRYRTTSIKLLRELCSSTDYSFGVRDLALIRRVPGWGACLLLDGGSNSSFFREVYSIDALRESISVFDSVAVDCDLVGSFRELNYYIDSEASATKNGEIIKRILSERYAKSYFDIDPYVVSEKESALGVFDSHLDQSVFHNIASRVVERLTGLSLTACSYDIGPSELPQELLQCPMSLGLFRVFEFGVLSYECNSPSGHLGTVRCFDNNSAVVESSVFVLGTSSCYSGLVPFLTYYFKRVVFCWGTSFEQVEGNVFASNQWRTCDFRVLLFRDRFLSR